MEFLDFEQAYYQLNRFERMVKFDNLRISRRMHYQILLLFARVAIMMKDLSKALEVCKDMEKTSRAMREESFEYNFCVSATYMYLGKLNSLMMYNP